MKGLHQREYGWPGGDMPGDIDFQHAVSESLTASLGQILSSEFPLITTSLRFRLKALHSFSTPSGSYLLETDRGCWFLRISSRIGDWQLEQAITEYLLEKGVSVNSIIASATFDWEGKRYRTDVRPLISGRHCNGDMADLSALASTLGDCHRALKHFSGNKRVFNNRSLIAKDHIEAHCLVDDALIRDNFEVFYEHQGWAEENREWIVQMSKYYDPSFHEQKFAQCLHGEIHPANVIFQSKDGSATLIDFETSIHMYAPPAWDLAYFILRFVLRNHSHKEDLFKCKSIIEEAYRAQLPPLSMMMRQTCWYSVMCAISNRLLKGMLAPRSELDKFIYLEGLAVAAQDIF